MVILLFCAALVLPPAAIVQGQKPATPVYDVIIRNGRVMDGTGNPWFAADIGIREGKIAALGKLAGASASRTIDAHGLLITPGFIDLHTHCDRGFDNPALRANEPWLRQGVTTVMVGVDGNGSWEPSKVAAPWLSTGLGTNVAFYVGHNTIRKSVMGIENRTPTPAELQKMEALVRQGMENGAFGLSTGLEYIPGIYSSTDEVVQLTRIAKQYGGIYDSHYRDEFHEFLKSVDEGIEIAQKAGIQVHLGHFKIIGKRNWGMIPEGLRRIRQARARGLEITLDQYPWDNGATSNLEGLIQVPPALVELRQLEDRRRSGVAQTQSFAESERVRREYLSALVKALNEPASRAQLRAATEAGLTGPSDANWIHKWGYDWIRVVRSTQHPDYVGKLISEIADSSGKQPFDVMADLIDSEPDIGVSIGPMLEANVAMVMKEPYVAFSSDGSLTEFGQGFPHPRAYGSFPRVFRKYVREDKIIALEDAVRKMTSYPAQILGMQDRGQIAIGTWADITIFDPATIADKSTYENPHQYSVGVSYVLVNGKVVLEDGKLTAERPGRLLLRGR